MWWRYQQLVLIQHSTYHIDCFIPNMQTDNYHSYWLIYWLMILFSRYVGICLNIWTLCAALVSVYHNNQAKSATSFSNVRLCIYLVSACDYANIPWIWEEDLWDGWCDGTNIGDFDYNSPSYPSYVNYTVHYKVYTL